jgi:trimeric autotransporter adhesin
MKNIITLILILLCVSVSVAQIPQTMSYQGVLTGTNGSPVPDGTVPLEFRLYNTPAGGDTLWQETQNVSVSKGIFNVILGSKTPLNLPFDEQYWLGITVANGTELNPRIALTASPYSLNSHSTLTEPLPGQGLTIRNTNGEATHQFSANGDANHSGVGTFLGGIIAGDTSIVINGINDTTSKILKQNVKKVTGENETVGVNGTGSYAGVMGISPLYGVEGIADEKGFGVYGSSKNVGVFGNSLGGIGVKGMSEDGIGIYGLSYNSPDGVGVYGFSDVGTGIIGSGFPAGLFIGNVKITDVPAAPDQERFLVWDKDSVVKYRTLPAAFNGVLQDKALILKSGGTEVFRVDTNGNSYHKGVETFADDVILTAKDGKGMKLMGSDNQTLAGFGRKDLDTGARIGVYGRAENPAAGDIAGYFDGDVEVNGEIYAKSIHVVNFVNGKKDTLKTSFNSDGTSDFGKLATFKSGIRFGDGTVQTTAGSGSSPWSSGNGTVFTNSNVGIGTSFPEVKLRVKGDALFESELFDVTGDIHSSGTIKSGNSIIVDGINHIITSDADLSFNLNNQAALKLVPNNVSPNLIGGFDGNSVTNGVAGAVISGGGISNEANLITDNYGTIGGGVNNQAGDNTGTTDDAHYATVGGGRNNKAAKNFATVAGGEFNAVNGESSTISGGDNNTINGLASSIAGGDGNTVSGNNSFIGGGNNNSAAGFWASLGGGESNSIKVNSEHAAIGGGKSNSAEANESFIGGGESNQSLGLHSVIGGGFQNKTIGQYSIVAGGNGNQATAQFNATILGGSSNTASANWAMIAGGIGNTASAVMATICGGQGNTANGDRSSIGGGFNNTASGLRATVPGGEDNNAGGDYSFAAGLKAKINSSHNGAFLFADATQSDFNSASSNEFAVRATGGVRFVTAVNGTTPTAGVQLAPGGSSWLTVSDRNAKTNFHPVDIKLILKKLSEIPIDTWSYKTQDNSIKHIGPMAQDFFSAFNVGEDNKHINTVDADGVALACIQGLYQLLEEKDSQIEELKLSYNEMEKRVHELNKKIEKLQSLFSSK